MHCVQDTKEVITVSINNQTLTFKGLVYPVSTSKAGIGFEEGSNKTPLGKFQVSEKFGGGEAAHAVYKGRVRVGLFSLKDNGSNHDMILSRILRLSGVGSYNHNTFKRYIYIHGTNNEGSIGTPMSIGCIRMKNLDIIDLYNRVQLGTCVNIKNN